MGDDTYVAGRLFQGGITYADLEDLEIYLGYGNDAFTIESTHAGTTLVDAGAGNDKVTVQTLSGHTLVYGGAGDDRVDVGTGGATSLLNSIKALLSFDGGDGYDSVYLDDRARDHREPGRADPDLVDRPGHDRRRRLGLVPASAARPAPSPSWWRASATSRCRSRR